MALIVSNAASSVEETITLKIQDHTGVGGKYVGYSLHFPKGSTVRDLVSKLETGRNLGNSSFADLFDVKVFIGGYAPLDLTKLDAPIPDTKVVTVSAKQHATIPPSAQMDVETPLVPLGSEIGPSAGAAPPPPPMGKSTTAWTHTTSSWSAWGTSTWDKKSDTGFVGLSNQGATCYMNSLIQSLFMTPEFRRAVYEWSFEEKFRTVFMPAWEAEQAKRAAGGSVSPSPASSTATSPAPKRTGMEDEEDKKGPETAEEFRKRKEKKSLPLQLQRLFARLQLSDCRAVETKKLTKSFGWTASDAFVQHDVQELCRVLFDKLEESVKGTHQSTLINDLFQGKMTDYVKCEECGSYSARQDTYLDIPLVIKAFGQDTAVKSVSEALRNFVTPEVLEGDNAYSCEKCAKKVKATKGLHFVSFPYILMLQLKRFDFDYTSMRRIKLNDRVSFPYTLDLNDLLEANKQAAPATVEAEAPVSSAPEGASEAEVKPTADRPYVYDLYGVLIHRGSAIGGHYFAYIKSLDDKKKWYEFNDSSVSEISDTEIKASFGESTTNSWGSGSNAYMLLYRRIDEKRNVDLPKESEVPEHVSKIITQEKEEEKKKKEEKQRKLDELEFNIYYKGQSKVLTVHKSKKVSEALLLALQLFGIDKEFDLDCVRLREYLPIIDVCHKPLDQVDASLSAFGMNYRYENFLIETKKKEETFPQYDEDSEEVKVYVPTTGGNFAVHPFIMKAGMTLLDLKTFASKLCGIPVERLCALVYKNPSWYEKSLYALLSGPAETTLESLKLFEGLKIFFEESETPDSPPKDAESPAVECMLKIRHKASVKVYLLGADDKEEKNSIFTVDSRTTLTQFKASLTEFTGLDASEMILSRGTINWKTECKDLNKSLEDNHITEATEVFIQKGKPAMPGEFKVELNLFDLQKGEYETLFTIPVFESGTVGEWKKEISQKLAQEKKMEIAPELIRVREMQSKTSLPGAILPDQGVVKDSVYYLYNGKAFAIQKLESPEVVLTKGDSLQLFVQIWHPNTLTFEGKSELILPAGSSWNQARAAMAEKLGVQPQDVGVANPRWSSPQGPTVLEAATELVWDKIPFSEGEEKKLSDSPLYLRSGEILVFRSNTEPIKQLSIEERQNLEKEAQTKKNTVYSYAQRKETSLKINNE